MSTSIGLDVRPDHDAVRGREDPAQVPAGVLLVGREVVEDGLDRVGERLARQLERVEQAADPRRPLRRRHADIDADPARRAQAVRDRLAMEQGAVAAGRLEARGRASARGSG